MGVGGNLFCLTGELKTVLIKIGMPSSEAKINCGQTADKHSHFHKIAN